MKTEREIVRGLRSRDPAAFEEMYRLYCDRIWRFLVRLAQNRALAEDLFQETWLSAAGRAHFLREESSLARWLYTIARNAHRVSWRNRAAELKKRARFSLASGEPHAADEAVAALVEIERAGAAMRRLPDAFREVLVLCCCEGLDSADAAAVLETSPEAVRKRLSRARAELTRVLNGESGRKGK